MSASATVEEHIKAKGNNSQALPPDNKARELDPQNPQDANEILSAHLNQENRIARAAKTLHEHAEFLRWKAEKAGYKPQEPEVYFYALMTMDSILGKDFVRSAIHALYGLTIQGESPPPA